MRRILTPLATVLFGLVLTCAVEARGGGGHGGGGHGGGGHGGGGHGGRGAHPTPHAGVRSTPTARAGNMPAAKNTPAKNPSAGKNTPTKNPSAGKGPGSKGGHGGHGHGHRPRHYRGWSDYCWFPDCGCYGYYCPEDATWYYWYGPDDAYRPVSDMASYPPDSSTPPMLPSGATRLP